MKLDRFRPGQLNAYQTILDRIRSGQTKIGVILPTGYGKSDLIRASALSAFRQGLISCALVISPSEYLRDQMVENDRFNGFIARYGVRLQFGEQIAYSALPSVSADPRKIRSNNEFLLSTTIQLIKASLPTLFPNWVDHMLHVTGKPVVIFVDETHTYSKKNRWGECIDALHAKGAIIVTLTATAIREDGEEIIGFKYHEVLNEPYKYTTSRPGEQPKTRIVDLFAGTKSYYQLEADYAYTFQEAWNEPLPPICHVNLIQIDVDLKSEFPDADDIPRCMLSEVAPSRVAQMLGRIVRNPYVIRKGCEELIRWLKKIRAAGPDCQKCTGIIFTASDEGTEINSHAEHIKRVISAIDPSFKVVIATSANDNGKGKDGKATLEHFVYDGVGDILIVKAMAGLGLDAPHIKVGLDLSPVRSVSGVIQRMNRTTRPYANQYIAHWITLAEKLMEAIFHKFVKEEGGAAIVDVDLVESWVVPTDEKPTPTVIIFGASTGGVTDTYQRTIDIHGLMRAVKVLEVFPELIGRRTLPDIAERASFIVPSEQLDDLHPVNTGDIATDLRSNINAIAATLTKLAFIRIHKRSYQGAKDGPLYGEAGKPFWHEAYNKAGATPGEQLSKISDINLLQRILNAFEDIVEREVANG